jgi:hypothetical protein
VIKDAEETAPHEAEARTRMVEVRADDGVGRKIEEMSMLCVADGLLATHQESIEAMARFVVRGETLDKLG